VVRHHCNPIFNTEWRANLWNSDAAINPSSSCGKPETIITLQGNGPILRRVRQPRAFSRSKRAHFPFRRLRPRGPHRNSFPFSCSCLFLEFFELNSSLPFECGLVTQLLARLVSMQGAIVLHLFVIRHIIHLHVIGNNKFILVNIVAFSRFLILGFAYAMEQDYPTSAGGASSRGGRSNSSSSIIVRVFTKILKGKNRKVA